MFAHVWPPAVIAGAIVVVGVLLWRRPRFAPKGQVMASRAPWGSIVITVLTGLVLALMWFGPIFLIRAHAATVCMASWYQRGRVTASGEAFRPDALTCALPSFRAGHRPYRVRVTHLKSGRSIVCRANDRGPAASTGRGIDLSRGAFRALGLPLAAGVARVRIDVLN